MDDMTKPLALESIVERIERAHGHGDQRQANVIDVLAALTPADLAMLVDNLDGQDRIAFDLWRQETIRSRQG